MEAIQGLYKFLSGQPVGAKSASVNSAAGSSDFDSTLKALLSSDPAKKVSEEELFSGLVQERIKKTKGDEALTEFQTLLSKSKESQKKADGFVPHEDATKEALRSFQAEGKLTQEEADSIYSQAFAAAQLDENKDALFDDRGGPNDPTMAVAAMEQALLLSKAMISKFDDGSETAPARSISEASNGKGAHSAGTSEAGSAGFLFKPVSDSDGKLAVLLPTRLAGMVKGVTLVGPNGEVLEKGRYTGNGNGGRDHFRFSKSGGRYPDGLTVQVTLMNDEVVRYIIRETSERNENLSSDSEGGSSGGQGGSGSSNGQGSGSSGQNTNTL
jgi:hypothetical protein